MRKTSYALTFLAVTISLILNILSSTRSDWLIWKTQEVLRSRITLYYGMTKVCELKTIDTWSNYTCRSFPIRDENWNDCTDKDGNETSFCPSWITASFAEEIGIGFGAVALAAILVGITTHSRRRRVWRAVAGLVSLQGELW